jgi:internalin A
MSETIPQWAQQRIDEARDKGLTELDLSGWGQDEKLTAVPDTIAQLTNLQSLVLSNNELTTIPAAIAQLTNLQSLGLSNNELTAVPDALAHLTNLQWLDLSGNQLTAVPDALTRLTNLQWLNLSRNQLTAVPNTLAQLTSLQLANLSYNQLTAIPATLAHLTDLQWLNLSRNQFAIVPSALTQLTSLRWLDLRGNQLTAVPHALAQLTNLQTLFLNGNRLTAVPPTLAQLTNLQTLDLSGNRLTTVPATLADLTNLQTLDLGDNLLTAVPPTFVQLTNLQTLNLNGNQLTAIPPWLVILSGLERLYLYENPITTPPPEVLEIWQSEPVNLKALRAYFQQQESGQARLFEAKLLIVGEPGAGKTSLTRKLLNPAAPLPAKDESTEGIDVHTWTFPLPVNREPLADIPQSTIPNPKSEIADFRVNIWDFGGQEIYHATHQFFLSRRSLYVVVADAREQKTDFYHWLDLIEHLSDRSPVFIFNNEVQNRHWAINEQQLQTHFPDTFQQPFAFNLADDTAGLAYLRQKIQESIAKLPHVGDVLPRTWVNVRNALENDDNHTLALVEFIQLCRDNGFTRREDALQLSGYLHDLGVILHFQDDPLLKHTVILKPEWGTDAAYAVLDNEGVKANNGRFSRADLRTIWQRDDYAYLHDELLALMMKFQLCYEIPGQKGQYIAPQLLGEQPPDYELRAESAEGLHLRYRYEAFMPKGILSRFIVAMHELIAGEGQWVWRTGVVLEKDGAQAEVVEFYHRREIRIRMVGKNRRDLLTIVSYELDKLHTPFHRLKFDKLIPCNCATCRAEQEPYFYRLEILKTRLKHGKGVIECDKPPFETVQIQPLIDDVGLSGSLYDLPALLRQMEGAFNLEDVKRLCFDLGIEYEDLTGDGRSGNMRELLRHVERHNRLPDLVHLLQQQRPRVLW